VLLKSDALLDTEAIAHIATREKQRQRVVFLASWVVYRYTRWVVFVLFAAVAAAGMMLPQAVRGALLIHRSRTGCGPGA
jgi:hypothetical protein